MQKSKASTAAEKPPQSPGERHPGEQPGNGGAGSFARAAGNLRNWRCSDPNWIEMRYDERKEGGRKEAVSSAEVQEDYHQSPLGARCLGPGRGGGRQRPGQGEGSRKQCPELESSVCCSVQPCRSNAWCSDRGGRLSKLQGGWCPVGRPVAGAPAARAALPAAPGLARWGRGQSSQTPPPSLVPPSFPPPSLFFLSSLLYRVGSTLRHSLLCPITVPGAGQCNQSQA